MLAQGFDPPGEAAVELPERLAVSRHRSCVDQVADRFRLEKVELSVEYGPSRELAGLCLTRPSANRRREHGRRDERSAVGRDLEEVFARERVRSPVEDGHHVVDVGRGIRIDDSRANRSACLRRRGNEQVVRQMEDVRTADPHHGKRSPALRRRDRGDRASIADVVHIRRPRIILRAHDPGGGDTRDAGGTSIDWPGSMM